MAPRLVPTFCSNPYDPASAVDEVVNDDCVIRWCRALRTESGFRGQIALFNFCDRNPINIIGQADTIRKALELIQGQPESIMMIMFDYIHYNTITQPFIALAKSDSLFPINFGPVEILARVDDDVFYHCQPSQC